MRPYIAFLSVCAGLWSIPGAAAAPAKPAQISVCESCHGPSGSSQKSDTPRLNGQPSAYLLERLQEFQDPTRGTAHSNKMMWQNATSFDDADAAALAEYFGQQKPTQRTGHGALADTGRKIFSEGAGPLIPGPFIPPCGTCHGVDGQGQGEVPRIAGQHGEYLTAQLQAFSLGVRVGTPMNKHAWAMTPDQINALSAFLSNE